MTALRGNARPRASASDDLIGRDHVRRALLAVALLTVLAFILRLVGIDQTLYGDENFTYSIITRNGFTGVWHDVYHTSVTPPLHYYLAWLSIHFGGDPTVLIRLPSLIFGTALVPLVFLLGNRVGGLRTGLVAATLIALGPFAIWYSDEARTYATTMFLVALSTLALLRATEGAGRGWWVVFAVSSCAALYSHYTAVFVLVAQFAWALWARREQWRPLALAGVAVVVGYLPWVPGFLSQRKNKIGLEAIAEFAPFHADTPVTVPIRTLVGHPIVHVPTFPGWVGLVLLVVLAALVAVAAAGGRPPAGSRRLAPTLRTERGLMLILAVATTLGLLLYALVSRSLYLPRNLSASLPALAVVVALAISMLMARVPGRVGALSAIALLALLGLNAGRSLGNDYRRPPYREAARYVERVAPGDAAIVEVPLDLTQDSRLPPTTVDEYLQHPRRVYRLGADAAAWRGLRSGRRVYEVTTHQLTPAAQVRAQQGVKEIPAGLQRRLERVGGPGGRAVQAAHVIFPGIIPVDVLRYDGVVDGRIERRSSRELISWTLGPVARVSPGVARGAVDALLPSGKGVVLAGWALAAQRPRLVDWFLFFSRNRLIAVSPGGGRRLDIARRYGPSALLSGFGLAVPAPPDRTSLRVFAVVGDRASELPLSAAARKALR